MWAHPTPFITRYLFHSQESSSSIPTGVRDKQRQAQTRRRPAAMPTDGWNKAGGKEGGKEGRRKAEGRGVVIISTERSSRSLLHPRLDGCTKTGNL